jgi:ABC-type glycerol-3-phosphate transport system substrate-binding protein
MFKKIILWALGVLLIISLTFISVVGFGAQKATLTFWTMDTEKVDVLKQMFKAFEKETGALVKVEYIPWGEVIAKWMTSFEAGTSADVSECGGTGLAGAMFWDQGRLLDLSPILKDITPERYLPELVNWGYYKDVYTCAPWFAETRVLFYHKDLFVEAGLLPPRNWDELLKCAQTLTKDTDGDGRVDQWGLGLIYSENWGQTLFSWMLNNNSNFDIIDKDLKAAVDNPAAVEALENYCDYLKYKVVPPGATVPGAMTSFAALFAQGKIAMVISAYKTGLEGYNPNLFTEDKVGFAAIPGKHGPGYSFMAGSSVWVNKVTKHPDLAKKLVKFLLSERSQIELSKAIIGTLPTRLSAYKDPIFQEDPLLKCLQEQIKYARAYGYSLGRAVPQLGRFYGEFVDGKMVGKVIRGEMTPEEGIKWYAKKINEIFQGK